MSGHIAHQVRLVSVLRAWESAEQAALLFPEVTDQQRKADCLHADLAHIAIACGYRPGREHRNVSIADFCRQRAAMIRRVFPNNLNETGL